MKHTYCGFCGSKFTEQTKYPRKCFTCYQDTFSNPLPAIATAIKVWSPKSQGYNRQWGVLIEKRAIEPQKGEWCLVGGYQDNSETWQETTSREASEEVGISLLPASFELIDVIAQPLPKDEYAVLFRSVSIPILYREQIKFVLNDEVSEIDIAYEPQELAFRSHTELLKIVLG